MTDQPSTSNDRRRGPLLAGAVAVAVLLAATGGFLLLRDDADDDGDSNAATTTAAGQASSTPSTADTGGTDEPAGTVPVGAIAGGSAAERCDGVVTRLEAYVSVAEVTPVPDASVVENFDEFTDEIFTLADGAEWGDRLIEDLTAVRREWSNAAAAASDGDDPAAQAAGAAALEELEAAISGADCPTG
jgi:hypothetical protein